MSTGIMRTDINPMVTSYKYNAKLAATHILD